MLSRQILFMDTEPSPSGEGGPAGPDEGGLPASYRERAALADFALISPLRGQLLPREKPFCVPKLLPFCYYFFAIA